MATNLENLENLENSRKIVKISKKTQGNLNFCRKDLENSGKMKLYDMIANKNAFHRIFLSGVAQGKILKCPGNLREKSGNFVSQKCGHPD